MAGGQLVSLSIRKQAPCAVCCQDARVTYMVDDEAHGGGVAQDHAGVPQHRHGVRARVGAAPWRPHALRIIDAALARALFGRRYPHLDCIGKAARSGLQTAAV